MSLPRPGQARPVAALVAALAFLASLVLLTALSGSGDPARARLPSTPSPLAPEAFRRVLVPGTPRPPTRPPTQPRLPETDLLERDRDAVEDRSVERRSAEPEVPAGPTHVVREGDTLWQIAAWHRADLELILRWNPDLDPRRLMAGQRVLVPGGEPMPSATPRPSRQASRPSTPLARSSGHLWPLPLPGTITTRFSAAHPGIDIAAPAGTPVRAIARGTVTWAGWKDNGGGYVVVIRHPDGMTSTYNHNRGVSVRVGEEVAVGEAIAAVGATGLATGPHLDLRIEMGGRLVDPLRLDWTR